MSGNHQTHIDDDRLGEILDEILAQYARGETPDLEAYALDNPELAAILRQAVPALRAVGAETTQGDKATTIRQLPGKTLGDFRICRELGQGGMGVVYEADQLSMGRRVALKVLPFAGMVQKKALERFRNEIRAVASLDHPNIVSVYAVGEERGIHFYAMKLVRGQPVSHVIAELARLQSKSAALSRASICQALTGNAPNCLSGADCPGGEGDSPQDITQDFDRLNPAAETTAVNEAVLADTWRENSHRRDYFRTLAHIGWQTAQALDHAHEHGILHRDIKPGNLMLDANINVFVTDFGLARIETDTALTMTGDLVGTLRYMSPEQALANRTAMDGRTDVYSLGATLYEMLALQPAYTSTNRQQLLQQIAYEEPRKLRSIDRAIPSELETIVHKALEKRPEDRYRNAAELAYDLRAFLDDRAILARPPTVAERVVKWTRRHTALAWSISISAALIVTLMLIGLFVNSLLMAEQRRVAQDKTREAQQQSAMASAVIDYINNDFLAIADPLNEPDRDIRLRTVLDRAAAGIDKKLQGQPLVAAKIRQTFGETYRSLGEFEVAEQHLRAAYQVFREQLGDDQRTTQECLRLLAGTLLDQGKEMESEQLMRQLLGRRKKQFGEEHPDTLQSMHDLAELCTFCGQYMLAKRFYTHVVQVRQMQLGIAHLDTLDSKQGLAEVLFYLGELQTAKQTMLEVRDARQNLLGDKHPQVLRNRQSLALLLLLQGDNQRAQQELSALFEIAKQTMGDSHPFTIKCQAHLATATTRLGEFELSGSLHQHAAQLASSVLGESHPDTLRIQLGRAEYLAAHKEYQAAVELYTAIAPKMQEIFGETFMLSIAERRILADCYDALERPEEATQIRQSTATFDPIESMLLVLLVKGEPFSFRQQQQLRRKREMAERGEPIENVIGAHPGILMNGTHAYTEKGQRFYQFDGVDDRLAMDDIQELAFSSSLTIECNIRVDSYPNEQQRQSCIVFRGDDRPGLDPYFLQLRSDGTIQFGISGSSDSVSLTAPVPQAEFVHVAATLDDKSGKLQLFVNGELTSATRTAVRPFVQLDAGRNPGIGIGNHSGRLGPNFPFHGVIAAIQLHDFALTVEQVQQRSHAFVLPVNTIDKE